jgi:hypothetical protein
VPVIGVTMAGPITSEAAGMTFQNHLFRLRAGPAFTPEFGCFWLNSSYALRDWNA